MAGAGALARLLWEPEPNTPFDPGGVDNILLLEEDVKTPFSRHLLQVMHENIPRSKTKLAAVREALVSYGDLTIPLAKVTLDTGASSGNYIGRAVLSLM